jgi:predicted nuclease of predicted toxin-antitoxin system
VREPLTVLLDQNVPQELALWLRKLKPSWIVYHTSELNLAGKSDEDVFTVGQERHAVIITFDQDFADRRSFPSQSHHGIVRLRVWPTTIEESQQALQRLLAEVSDEELAGALVIVGRSRIRIRSRKR